mmetsp:Transcript_30959/g.56582  ORF Transcript_30959/g.56582 Transcript_30959/m.56582 type:complete len:91 (+) Transcript_30959:1-273(+)
MDLLERAKEGFRNVNFRYTIAPTKKMTWGFLPFSFNSKQIKNMIKTGQEDAARAIKYGEGVSTADLMEYTKEKTAHRFSGDYNDWIDQKH